jgi:hypothetical protein
MNVLEVIWTTIKKRKAERENYFIVVDENNFSKRFGLVLRKEKSK